MQNLIKLIALTFSLFASFGVKGQSTFLCSGEQVNLQAQSNYWGQPQWEFSPNGFDWTIVSLTSNLSFSINSANSGYYRLIYIDEDCNTNYTSDIKQIKAFADSFNIRCFFSNFQIPDDADPVFWYESQDSLSQITYFLNGIQTASTSSLLQAIENPGSNFEIYATAINQNGCNVFSPVYTYSVYNSVQTGNGDLQLTGNFNFQEVLISSSVDSLNAVANGDFEIDYSYSMGFDVIFASRPSLPAEQQLIGLCVLYSENESFVLNSESTALSMVLMLQDVTNMARIYPDIVKNYIQQNSQFVVAVNEITEQLNTNGFIDIQDANLWQIIRTIGEDVVNNLFPTFFDACLVPDAPNIQINGDHLKFENCGINTAYFARLYNNANQPVSNPILFLGDGQTMWGNDIFNWIGNLLISNPSTAALFEAYQARVSDKIFPGDVTNYTPFDELKVRLTNGKGPENQLEDGAAEAYNDFTFIWSFASSLMQVPKLAAKKLGEVGACAISVVQIIVQKYNEDIKPSNYSSVSELTNLMLQFYGNVSNAVDECYTGPQNDNEWFGLRGKIIKYSGQLGFWSEAGWMVQYLNDWHTKIPKLKYTGTLTGNQWLGKLKIESNSDQTFYGIPGSLSYKEGQQPNPTFRFKVSPLFATYEDGSTLSAAEYVDLSQSQMNGFSAFGISTSTQSVKFNNGETNQGLFFNNVSLSQAATEINWRFSNSVPTPEVATLNVNFKYNNFVLPSYIEGLGESIGYSALIESPQLTIDSGNGQTGTADEILQNNCKISLTGSFGRPARDCPIRFEITQGGGKLKNTSPWEDNGETTTKLINTLGENASDPEIGSASIRWRLGAQGDQKMKVTYKPAEIELTIIEFTAIVNNGNGNGNGSSTSVTDIDGNVYQAIQIGNQVWSKENLRTTKFSDGSIIPNVTSNAEWIVLNSGAWCNFENNPSYDSTYGKLYNYSAVADPRNVCPTGWHVPTDAEWTVLTDYLGGLSIAGGKMKATSFWQAPNTGATNESGFTGLPGGSRSSSVGGFGAWGTIGWWWSSSYAWYRALGYEYGYVNRINGAAGYTRAGLSVRCLKD